MGLILGSLKDLVHFREVLALPADRWLTLGIGLANILPQNAFALASQRFS